MSRDKGMLRGFARAHVTIQCYTKPTSVIPGGGLGTGIWPMSVMTKAPSGPSSIVKLVSGGASSLHSTAAGGEVSSDFFATDSSSETRKVNSVNSLYNRETMYVGWTYKYTGKLFCYSSFIANSEKCFWAPDGNRTRNLLISSETRALTIEIPGLRWQREGHDVYRFVCATHVLLIQQSRYVSIFKICQYTQALSSKTVFL